MDWEPRAGSSELGAGELCTESRESGLSRYPCAESRVIRL